MSEVIFNGSWFGGDWFASGWFAGGWFVFETRDSGGGGSDASDDTVWQDIDEDFEDACKKHRARMCALAILTEIRLRQRKKVAQGIAEETRVRNRRIRIQNLEPVISEQMGRLKVSLHAKQADDAELIQLVEKLASPPIRA